MRGAKAGRWIAGIVAVLAVTACPDGTSPPEIASVQMTATSSNPRVGETATIGATPVNSGGVAIQGVTCTFASGTPTVATVNATTGSLVAVSEGTTVITATCGGVANT